MKRLISIYNVIGLSVLVALALSCNRSDILDSEIDAREPSLMKFYASYPIVYTRANETGFADGDEMGVYVVDYVDGNPGILSFEENRADNMCFTYDEASRSWNSPADIYWKDKSTPVDIYGYYPFDASLSSVDDYRFSVSVRQDAASSESDLGGYEASDLLWAKSEGVHPTAETIVLNYGHIMAGVKVVLQEGEGFEPAQWASLDKTVLIKNVLTDATVDVANGFVEALTDGKKETIVPCLYNEEYRAVVVPQELDGNCEILSITIDGKSYSYSRSAGMTYTPGKMHVFTIRVDNKAFDGEYDFTIQEVTISEWVDDPDFCDGITRAYVSVNVDIPGSLRNKLFEAGKDYERISNLKVSGKVNHADLEFMGQQMPALAYLNIREVKVVGGPEEEDVLTGFDGHSALKGVVFPKYVRKIAEQAFRKTGLIGSLVIPEGVEEIGAEAFYGCNALTSVQLPNSIRCLRGGAFARTNLQGTIILPEGLEIVGPNHLLNDRVVSTDGVFDGCKFSGSYRLPSTLKYYETLAMPGMVGDIVIPDGISEITPLAHESSTCTSVTIPEGVTVIGGSAFRHSSIKGELRIPSTCKEIYSQAFHDTDISRVIFPDGLAFLGNGVFGSCERLSGVITLPKGIVAVPELCFDGCKMLDGVVLHEDVLSIDKEAFRGCHNMSYFVCLAEEPPYVAENAFYGVPRNNFTIEVPAGAVEKYKRAPGWKEFKRIAEYSNFVCRPATTCALNSARRQTLVLNADGPWTVSRLPEWCSITPSSGEGKTELTLTIDALTHGSEHRADSVVFTLADGGHNTWCAVSQYDYEHDEDEVVVLQEATKGNGIDVVFLGDGWDGETISNGSYMSLVQEQMEHFFGIEPYTTYRDYFNVYAGIALSQETGVNTLNTYRDTKFMTLYGGGGCNNVEAHLSIDKDAIFDYVVQYSALQREDMPESLVILVPNSTDYGGCTYIYDDGSAISICCPSDAPYPSDTRGIIQHEAGGHGFGKLGDERILRNQFADSGIKGQIDSYHGRGWYQNVATSGKMSDVPWSHFIFDPEYSDYVDIFEGAMGFTRGVWRSEQNSCMNYGIPYYNAISRQEIMRRILDYSGEGFTMEKFYATDSKSWGSSSAQTKAMPDQAYVQNAWHTAPYID